MNGIFLSLRVGFLIWIHYWIGERILVPANPCQLFLDSYLCLPWVPTEGSGVPTKWEKHGHWLQMALGLNLALPLIGWVALSKSLHFFKTYLSFLWKEHGRVPGCALVRIKCTCKLLNIRPFGSCSKWLRDTALMTSLSTVQRWMWRWAAFLRLATICSLTCRHWLIF